MLLLRWSCRLTERVKNKKITSATLVLRRSAEGECGKSRHPNFDRFQPVTGGARSGVGRL